MASSTSSHPTPTTETAVENPPSLIHAFEAFETLIELEITERELRLEEIENSDAELADQVRRLLDADRLPDFTISPQVISNSDMVSAEGTTVGAYRIEREIGRGGMGTVYLAKRIDGAFSQKVAVKIIASPVLSITLIERQKREGQILGKLEHPGIASILDAGTFSHGAPYLVMEYVDGIPLDAYCDLHRLSTRQRITIFCKVCEAVAYAHRQLVVHRDLKPGNVLVNANGQPKLLDFGIAKILQDDLIQSSHSTLTRISGSPLTPDYASPEQLLGEPITTQSDVYSLGVILHQLLTVKRPFSSSATSNVMSPPKRQTSVTPTKPSENRISVSPSGVESADSGSMSSAQRSQKRHPTTSTPDIRRLQGELYAIIAQASHHDVERRYRSVDELQNDLQRYQAGRPVRARPDTTTYRIRKFVGRNRLGVAAALALLVAIIVGVFSTFWQANLARAQRNVAEQTAETALREITSARKTSKFLVSLLESADSAEYSGKNHGGPNSLSIDILKHASSRLETELRETPLERADLHQVIGNSFLILSAPELAQRQALRSLELRRAHLPEAHRDIVASYYFYGAVLSRTNLSAAMAQYQRAIELDQRLPEHSTNYPYLLADAANLANERGDFQSAHTLHDEVERLTRKWPVTYPLRQQVDSFVFHNLVAQGQPVEALERAAAYTEKTGIEPTGNWKPLAHWLLGNLDEAAQYAAHLFQDNRANDVWLLRILAEANSRNPQSISDLNLAQLVQNFSLAPHQQGLLARIQMLQDIEGWQDEIEQALVVLERDMLGPTLALADGLETGGLARLSRGDHAGARSMFSRSLNAWKDIVGVNSAHSQRLQNRLTELDASLLSAKPSIGADNSNTTLTPSL